MSDTASPSLKTRVISAVVISPVIIAILLYGGWPFIVLITAAFFISLYEWKNIAQKTPNYLGNMVIGIPYLLISISSFFYLRLVPDQGLWLSINAVLCVWASDSGAYFVGKSFGGPKMAPKISPKKTLSGLGGAMVFCGATLALLYALSHYIAPYTNVDLGISPSQWWLLFLIGCTLGFVGQIGDLFISSLKRKADVKDSGALIPGHGGLLDRIDALLLVAPAYLLLMMLWLT